MNESEAYILDEKLKKFHRVKQNAEHAEALRKELQKECVALFEKHELDTAELVYEIDAVYKATCVQSETVKIDEDGLKAKLGEDVWEQITTSKLDMKKLESMVATGAIAVEHVEEYSTIVPRTPYVKITKAKTKLDD